MKLGEYIAKYIVDHEISQRQFAESIGVSAAYMSMLIRGINSSTGKPIVPTYPVVKKIAKRIGITVDQLVESVEDFDIYMSDIGYGESGIAVRMAKKPDAAPTAPSADPEPCTLESMIARLQQMRTDPTHLEPDEAQLIRLYRSMVKADRQRVMRIIKSYVDPE